MNDYVHIVCLDAPSPPEYGGAMDMFYKIVALHATGKRIILHYFDYKPNRNANGLTPYCEEINVYKRSVFLKSLLTLKPYIVSSRIEPDLIHRLNRDDYPVLLEGLHCTGIIPHLNPQKKIVVRIHNNEAEYYQTLYNTEPNFFRKLYFLYESVLLSRYQGKLPDHPAYAFISSADKEVFSEQYQLSHQQFIPAFIPWQAVTSKTGKGEYCLYHGNLQVSENFDAAVWLIEHVFSKLDMPLVVAGKNANALQNIWPDNNRVRFVDHPSDEELTGLIQNAHIHVLPSVNATGIKLKLLHALFEGRFCITNYNGAIGSGIENRIRQAESVDDWIHAVQESASMEFTNEMVTERKRILTVYDNISNAIKLNELL